MSAKPSWLDDEDNQANAAKAATAMAKNPVAQKVAKDVAKDPKVQAAVKDAVVASIAPSWASDSAPVAATAVNDVEAQRKQSDSTCRQDSEFVMDPEQLKEMQKWHLALRVLYMLSAIFLGVAAVLALLANPAIGQFFFRVLYPLLLAGHLLFRNWVGGKYTAFHKIAANL